MKRWARFIFIFFAYSIALLHTAVPHHHFSTRGETILAHNGCVFSDEPGGLLQRVFSTDLGLGHLETFKKNSDAQIEFSSRFIGITVFIPVATVVVSNVFAFPELLAGYVEKFRRQLLLFSITSFRAPPVL